MRKRFEVQYELGVPRIEDVKIPTRSRDELPPVLRALQYIYSNQELNNQIFELLNKQIVQPVQKTGRYGMSLWEILVFAVVRLNLDIDYDRLHHISNYDSLVRSLLGLSNIFSENMKQYSLQTLKDNVELLDEETIKKISEIVVKSGHTILSKKNEELTVKIDSYVYESNVHFPTDANLLWDSARKSIELSKQLMENTGIVGWRKIKDWRQRIKNAFYRLTKAKSGKGKNSDERMKAAASEYIELTREFSEKLKTYDSIFNELSKTSARKKAIHDELKYYQYHLDNQINLLERRVVFGEIIQHDEKIFSLFEPYTEWIQKGKAGNKVEFGLKLAVSVDQFGFILNYRMMNKEQDVDFAVPMIDDLLKTYGISRASFDKGYWSKENFLDLSSKLKEVVMPKKGKLNQDEYEREHSKTFVSLRKQHSAVESAINCLEHHGVNRCPDRGEVNFKKYAALGILATNLHKLGNILLEKEQKLAKAA